MSNEIVVDVHELQPPEPMELALNALDKLGDGDYIKMIHRMQPMPLYRILDENGFRYKAITGTTSAFDIYIWRASDKAAQQAVKAIIG
ncbi:MAG TPA: DUF2249 domain-containing protein [Gammaproteobacteria bacterium]